MTQIVNLLNLSPGIQEKILFLGVEESGREPIAERNLWPIATVADWRIQRWMWRTLESQR